MFPDSRSHLSDSRLTPLQNAFVKYKAELEEKNKITNECVDELRQMGRWVVITLKSAYCPRSDAMMGECITIIGDYATFGEAAKLAEVERLDHPQIDDEDFFKVEVFPPPGSSEIELQAFREWFNCTKEL